MKNKKLDTKTSIVLGVILVSVVTILGLVTAYGYAVNVLSKDEKISVESLGDLKLVYKDCDSGDASTCANISKDLGLGESATKVFEVTNESLRDLSFGLYFRELTNTFKNDELVYKVENLTTGEVLIEEKAVKYSATKLENVPMVNSINIPANTTHQYKLTVTFLSKPYDQAENASAIYNLKVGIGDVYTPTIVENIIASAKSGNPNFAEAATTDEGVYAMADDYGTSYYYRGAVENNYVKFGGFWWRIIRINGDGSLRIIYDGTQAHTNGTSSTDRLALTSTAWHPQNEDAKYVGYMFGPSGSTASTSKEEAQTNETDSNIKTQLESWYKTNIYDKNLDQYVSDEIFCNDRSTTSGNGYGMSQTNYGANGRVVVNPQPQFTCLQKNDAFTKDDTEKGNGALSQKVGLITADEIVAAGSGKYKTTNTSYYLYKGSNYWSLSPYIMLASAYTNAAFVLYINSNGNLNSYSVTNKGGVAPVINLSAKYVKTLIGDGTIGNEYRSAELDESETPSPAPIYYKLTISYVNEDGESLVTDFSKDYEQGKSYSVSSPVVEGYTPDQAVVAGTMPNKNVMISVVYSPSLDTPDPISP